MMDIHQSLDTIAAMLCQEISYRPPSIDEDPTSERFSSAGIDSRGRMLSFFYNLMERIDSHRETAEVAISYLDRFLASPLGAQALRNKKLFQVASTTCLYVAVKIHELAAITPTLLADLSHGIFTAKEVEEMELILMHTLKWRMNPPTSLAFVEQYLELVPLSEDMKRAAYDMARHQAELALEDPRLFCEKKSLMAYMALQNAFEHLQCPADLSDTVGVLLAPEEHMTAYRYNYLRTVLRSSLTCNLGLVLGCSTPEEPKAATTTSWFSMLRTVTPPPESHYRVSPRSVNNSIA